MIPVLLEQCFPPDVRERGEAYTDPFVLTLEHVDAVAATAAVQGTRTYGVFLRPRPGRLHLGCTCPRGQEHGACKHLWALLRVLDAQGTLVPLLETAASSNAEPQVTFERHALAVMKPQARAIETKSTPAPEWQTALRDTSGRQRSVFTETRVTNRATSLPADRRIVYLLHLTESAQHRGVRVEITTQRRDRDSVWEEPKHFQYSIDAWCNAPDPGDRHIAEMLLGSSDAQGIVAMPTGGFIVRPRAYHTTLRMICETGRARLRSNRPSLDSRMIGWDDGIPWQVAMRLGRPTPEQYQLVGELLREDLVRPLGDASWIHESGLVLFGNTLARLDSDQVWPLVQKLWTAGEFELGDDPAAFLAEYHALPNMPRLSLPAGEMHIESDAAPLPVVRITSGAGSWRASPSWLTLRFRYGSEFVDAASTASTCFDKKTRTLYRRRAAAERNAMTRLRALGAQEMYSYAESRMSLVVQPHTLPRLISSLVRDGWLIESDGATFVAPSPLQVRVSSGIDWFDLTGTLRYGDHELTLSQLLTAMDEGSGLIEFGNGVIGFLPEESLDELRALLAIGVRRGDGIRFRSSQLALLDVLLAALPDVDVDETLASGRAELKKFQGINVVPVPRGFVGTLRGYQEEGLSWFGFLRRFALGGCLADDMGLGKTIQVLALLEARREEGAAMSLLVVPRSLVFNWVREAARFTPALKVHDLSHAERSVEDLDTVDAHLAITTYGTLRRDIARLGSRRFDYVILDEAQAIKNAGTATAKACRLLQADHRLALSGTPIENRIEELWSLFEFLNPGMLGAATTFSSATRALAALRPGMPAGTGVSAQELLSRALRPVVLRRTKAMVAKELPARIEQTIEVELEPKQRAFYEQLRSQYATSLLDRVERDGLGKSRMHILEALLRLRQAACHPALVDPTKASLPSAKLDAVVPALQEIAAEGNKVLVFSQFTSFLSLLRARLDALGVPYEYLDGRTRDRQARVDRFQSADGPPLFLISLKAGGHGLNLTAAEYVYLLDPWWNPAVEAQAIDRAHRIGQTSQVIATRVVARDTIESKILELQASKRALADAILSEDKGGLAGVGREELQLLLG